MLYYIYTVAEDLTTGSRARRVVTRHFVKSNVSDAKSVSTCKRQMQYVYK